MTARPTIVELAIETAAINALTRKADGLRALARDIDVQRALNQYRLAAELDACAFGLFGIAEATVHAVFDGPASPPSRGS